MKELSDQVGADEKSSIEHAINALKEAVKGDNKEDIEAKTNDLTELSGKLAERVYAQKSASEESGTHGDDGSHEHHAKTDDDVVDAEFEEIKKD